ncbi:TrbL/VirB6 family protein [Kribbella swartbergensis]
MSWTDCLLNPTTCIVSMGTDAVTDSWWNSFMSWMARGLTQVTSYVFQAFSQSTAPRFDQQWWQDNLDMMIGISLPLLVGIFVLQCVSAVIRREPGRLGHALVGALLGTAGVPLAVAVVASLGQVVDQISTAILGNRATADGLKRMVDLSIIPTLATLGGFLLTAVIVGLLASISLYFVMLIREVAIVAFVVFAPIAMASWTWSATRHWLRRWIEVVGALLFSKIAMAVVFTVGISAAGNGYMEEGQASIGTFLTGVLLLAMAAFAPLATFSFIHWVGDHGAAAAHALRQGTAGTSALKERFEQAQQWGAHHFGGSSGNESGPVVGGDSDAGNDKPSDDSAASASWATDQSQRSGPAAGASSSSSPEPAPAGQGSTAIAVSTSQVSVDGSGQPGQQGDNAGDHDKRGEGN